MSISRTVGLFLLAPVFAVLISAPGHAQSPAAAPAPVYSHTPSIDDTFRRDPAQPVDEAYTEAIRRYTTDPQFGSPLVDYLPASTTVPTPRPVVAAALRRSSEM